MSEENSSGAAYLAAFKRSTPQGSGAAPAPAPVLLPEKQTSCAASAGITNSQAAERRRSPRYRCQEALTKREAGSSVGNLGDIH